MTTITKSAYSDRQITAWLRGLYTIALADGFYAPEEQDLIAQLTQDLADLDGVDNLEAITAEELAANLGKEPETAENFLRTAVLVAVADGVYSPPEYELMHQFSTALEIEVEALKSLENTLYKPEDEEVEETTAGAASPLTPPPQKLKSSVDVLYPVKDWLDGMEVKDPRLARFVCKVIPPQCPFERDINLFGRTIAHIPPLCKLNPLYEQFTTLRFRSLSYLADECGEDVTKFIQ
ncbi:Mo-dependent nitrogenase C-terminal domain-containing protein [Pleurocapsa sp. PCC 7319]|uniref:Mo-dependent nitrogenase C-terminal domain-containing protein n=1 Tax=Pleurocapsa sp. PCC 7319 TaxID=118161 RepID=UPI00034799BF|nr:Mo-dependent nitrogenase C-terminal domain-containing protein [Pleurocapsa sp. PCC 7319]